MFHWPRCHSWKQYLLCQQLTLLSMPSVFLMVCVRGILAGCSNTSSCCFVKQVSSILNSVLPVKQLDRKLSLPLISTNKRCQWGRNEAQSPESTCTTQHNTTAALISHPLSDMLGTPVVSTMTSSERLWALIAGSASVECGGRDEAWRENVCILWVSLKWRCNFTHTKHPWVFSHQPPNL